MADPGAMEGVEKPVTALPDKSNAEAGPSRPRRRFVGTTNSKAPVRRVANQIPEEILNDGKLNAAIAALPGNYKFEIHKTIHHIRRDNIKVVALQMPEGLMVYGCAIADIVEELNSRFTGALPLLLADVTYGACCIDDFTAREMGAEMIVHYGHSCLIPVSQVSIKTLYVFVEIGIDNAHLAASVRRNFPSEREAFGRIVLGAERGQIGGAVPVQLEGGGGDRNSVGADMGSGPTRLALVSTIQFVAAAQSLKDNLVTALPDSTLDPSTTDRQDALIKPTDIFWRGAYDITVPQSRPLSPGEVLGCTAPKLNDVDALIYVGDGRFHLESIMIANPTVPAFRYDPYSKKFTREVYEHGEMRMVRGEAVKKARAALDAPEPQKDGTAREKGAGGWGVVLGTLGRQGSLAVLKTIQQSLSYKPGDVPPYMLLLSELSPLKLSLLPQLSVFVQTSCPRLSIDWGYAFDRPLLSPYEASVALGKIAGWEGLDNVPGLAKGQGGYPMDFYADHSLGPWTPRYRELTEREKAKAGATGGLTSSGAASVGRAVLVA